MDSQDHTARDVGTTHDYRYRRFRYEQLLSATTATATDTDQFRDHSSSAQISSRLTEVRHIKQDTAQLLASLDDEERYLVFLQKKYNNDRARINKLPNEILGLILLNCAAYLDETPWNCPAFAVCFKWRSCALQTPQIWSYITVANHSTVKSVECALARSGATPVIIDIKLTGPMNQWRLPMFLTVLGPALQRCQHLDVDVSLGLDIIMDVFTLLSDCPTLRNLRVVWEDPWEKPTRFGEQNFPDVPLLCQGQEPVQLRRLVLQKSNFEGVTMRSIGLSGVDPAFLTSMCLGTVVNPLSVWALLPGCHSLRCLEWTFYDRRNLPMPSGVVPFELPALRTLRLSCKDPSVFLRVVETPVLVRLFFKQCPSRPSIWNNLLELPQLGTLQVFSIAYHGDLDAPLPSDDILRSLLSKLRAVEALCLPCFADENISALDALLEYPIVCPELTYLVIGVLECLKYEQLNPHAVQKIILTLAAKRKIVISTRLDVALDVSVDTLELEFDPAHPTPDPLHVGVDNLIIPWEDLEDLD